MKANELRIGNILMFTDSPAKREWIIRGQDIAYAEKDPDWLNLFFDPIPLTPEWLERLGFKESGVYGRNDSYKSPCGHYFMEKKHIKEYADYSLKDYNTGQFINSFEIKYVHELQNLYFALTGQELTLQK